MSDREQDKRVAEILGWTFWSEQRGEYLLHLVWPPKKDPPYRQSRDWEVQKRRYAQLDTSELKWGNCVNKSILPRFTTDPAADYKVLEWVRESLLVGMSLFVERLELAWPDYEVLDKGRVYEKNKPFMSYQPGDYSRALLALDEQGLLK